MTNGGSETLYEANAEPRSFGSRLWARVRPFRWLLVAAALPFLWFVLLYSHETVRFRIVVEIDTPSGVRVGSGVMVAGVECSSLPLPGPRCRGWSAGQAFPIDLGDGRRVIALLSSERAGDGPDYLQRVYRGFSAPVRSVGTQGHSLGNANNLYPGQSFALEGTSPTLVLFERPDDFRSARVVFMDMWPRTGVTPLPGDRLIEDRAAKVLGPGHAIKSTRVEIVGTSQWPGRWFFVPGTAGVDQPTDRQIDLIHAQAGQWWTAYWRESAGQPERNNFHMPDSYVVPWVAIKHMREIQR